jgi:hypothetical protein
MRGISRLYLPIINIFWAILLILLPVTSMPAVRDLLHISVIAGPSVLILAILLVVWFIPYLLRKGELPREILPLLGFFFAAVLSIAIVQFMPVPSFKDASILRPALSAIVTLLVGLGYLSLTYSFVKDEEAFCQTMRWIYLGGVLMVVWSILQISTWILAGRYPAWMRDMQDLFSLGPLYRQRATGFALEPSWLAHMLNMLYLPMWLAASISQYSIFHWRLFRRISVEMILLVLGILTLVFSLSRVGWITFFCMLAYLLVKLNIRVIRWMQLRMHVKNKHRLLSSIVFSIGVIAVYLVLLVLAAFGMSRVDPRMADLFTPSFWQLNNLNRYANALQFGERVVYWQAGWEVFNRYPVLGVGLGNAGKWFEQTIPAYGMNLVEVRKLLFRSGDIPNIKNLWIRLLAETGIVGFSFFCAWLFGLLRKSISSHNPAIRIRSMCAYWGIFIVIGLLLEGFSIDSFAMPFFWVSAGMVLSVLDCKERTGNVTKDALLEDK